MVFARRSIWFFMVMSHLGDAERSEHTDIESPRLAKTEPQIQIYPERHSPCKSTTTTPTSHIQSLNVCRTPCKTELRRECHDMRTARYVCSRDKLYVAVYTLSYTHALTLEHCGRQFKGTELALVALAIRLHLKRFDVRCRRCNRRHLGAIVELKQNYSRCHRQTTKRTMHENKSAWILTFTWVAWILKMYTLVLCFSLLCDVHDSKSKCTL